LSQAVAAPEIPGKPQERPIALVGGTVHPVSGPAIERATVLFEKGKLTAIGKDAKLPPGTESINVQGKHVYPGLLDAYTTLGLVEIDAVRATKDQSESGTINPNAKAQVAFNPDSELIPVARSNGVLAVLSVPLGGLMSGSSAVMQLDGWTWEEMTVRPIAGIHVRWPRTTPIREFLSADPENIDQKKSSAAIENVRQALADARAYLTAKKAASPGKPQPQFDARWEALIPVLEGQTPLIVDADEIQQIQACVAWAAKEKLKIVLWGGYDAPHCLELLKKHDVPVIIGGVHRLPARSGEPYDHPFTLAKRLHDAGIRYCISSSGDAWAVRNLPYHAATSAAYGLSPEEALKSITLYPAEILGVADRLGSLETGKDATLFVADGDILEIPTQVEQAYIQGRKVDLSDRHKRLYEKYQEKYRRLGIQR
jgi:imidazolonepropionase-like amidohydrolase